MKRVDIYVRRGDTFRRTLRLRVKASRAPIDISGDSFSGQIRSLDRTLLATFTCTITDGPNGEVEILLEATTTAALDVVANAIADYDLQWTTAGGDVRTIMGGKVYFESDTTHA